MQRLSVGAHVFVCPVTPRAVTCDVVTALRAAVAAVDFTPDVLYWDLVVESEQGIAQRVYFGSGGIDPVLASACDISAATAVRAEKFSELGWQDSDTPKDMRSRLGNLVRSPKVKALYCPGVTSLAASSVVRARPGGMPRSASADSVSIAVLSTGDDDDLPAILDRLAAQTLTARLEIIVLISGPGPVSGKARTQAVDDWMAQHRKVRVRRFILWGEFGGGYLANTAMAMATSEVVVVVDPRCEPGSPHVIQNLANWADSADVASVGPRITHRGSPLAAGLAIKETGEGLPTVVSVLATDPLGDAMRLCAAPTPWCFATRRRGWVAAGGVPFSADGLWTAPLAGGGGPQGRHLLVGSESVEWAPDQAPGSEASSAPAPRTLRASTLKALRIHAGDAHAPVISTLVAKAAPAVSPAPRRKRSEAEAGGRPAFSDGASVDSPHLRLLIFADAFGASQSIAFVEGLSEARRQGVASVTVFAEADLAGDVGTLDFRVEDAFVQFNPTVVVVSRMADPGIWRAVRAAARSRALPILFHIDDNLFDVPLTLGIERYRLARQPRRLHTLHAILETCDLALAASVPLARELHRYAGHGRIVAMPTGGAARPPAMRHPRSHGGAVVGYMGSASHNNDLAMIAPALNRAMAARPGAKLVLFGSIAKQSARKLLTGAVSVEPGVFGDYVGFRRRLAELAFDIGLAPLTDTVFNRCKTPVKWVEYGEAGTAVLASDVTPYRPMAAADAVMTVGDDGWENALVSMIDDAPLRSRLVTKTDALLKQHYAWDRFESGMLSVLTRIADPGLRAA